jgi:hypothetical protein
VVPDQSTIFSPEAAELRWFLTPWEAKCDLLGSLQPQNLAHAAPFSPPRGGRVEYAVPGSLCGALDVSDALRGILRQKARPPSQPWTDKPQVGMCCDKTDVSNAISFGNDRFAHLGYWLRSRVQFI